MTQFKTVEDVKKAFKLRANGGNILDNHRGFRYEDIDKHSHILEKLLDTDYNKISGYAFTEIAEAMSTVQTNYGSDEYFRAYQEDRKAIRVNESMLNSADSEYYVNEAFEGTTIAQAPFPVPAVSLVTYQYEKSVLPFLCHQFDLKGNRGIVYYQNIKATNAKGNIAKGDLLGSPKEIGKQPVGFVGTHVTEEVLGVTVVGDADYDALKIANAPIQPGSLVISVEGADGYFKDFATEDARDGVVMLTAVNGDLGTCSINYTTGDVDLVLRTSPTTAGLKFKATYNRDVETIEGGKANQATFTMELESKQLIAEQFSIFTNTNLHQEALARAVFGLDWNHEVDKAMEALYNKEVANKIVTEIKAKLTTDAIFSHDVSNAIATGGNNALFNTQFIAVVIGKLRKVICAQTGIGINRLAAIAINADVLPIIEALPKYTAATATFEESMSGMALVGLYDGIPVLLGYAPVLAAGEIMGIYKSKTNDFLTPYVFGTFIQPVIRDIYDQDNLAVNRKQLISSAAGQVVAERLASKLTITGIDAII